ncbi:MAG: hypothetical protein O2788_01335, partial [Chloroflexi bacterium]|nr:hypothetical protein [Chloroflexota bacterium]
LSLAIAAGCSRGGANPTVAPNPTSTPRPTATATNTPPPSATVPPTVTPTPTPSPTPTPTPTPQAPDSAYYAIFDLATLLGVPVNTISVADYDEHEWGSTDLGCPAPATFYTQVVTPGWIVFLKAGNETFEYHVDSTGDSLVNCTVNRGLIANSINIAALAKLRTATQIEMRRRDGTGEFVLKRTVTEASEILAIVDTLDVPVQLHAAASCTEVFRLVFVTPTGNQTIGTICGGNNRLIRGAQGFWGGQDADAPASFGAIIGPYFSDEPLPGLPQ